VHLIAFYYKIMTMHGPLIVKLLVILLSKPRLYGETACFHGNNSYTNIPQSYVTQALPTLLWGSQH